MKRIRRTGPVCAIAFAALLGGCLQSDDSLSPSTDLSQDENALQETVNVGIPDYADPDVFLYDDPILGPRDGEPFRWWREVLNVDKTIQISISQPNEGPSTATVGVAKDVSGILHVLQEGDVTIDQFKKNFEYHAARSLYFERQGPPLIHPRRGWKLKALTGALIESPEATRQINSVRIQCANVDQTFTNVTDLVRVQDLLRLDPNTEVSVLVDTGDASDQVFLHVKRHRMRFALTNNSDGTFTGVFATTTGPGPRHVVVDVLANSTLTEETAPYDNIAWGIPYLIVGEDDQVGDGSNGGDDDDN